MNLLCSDALSVDWPSFTGGTDHVHLVGNPPFVKYERCPPSVRSFLPARTSSDYAWLMKAEKDNYSFVLLGNHSLYRPEVLTGHYISVSDKFEWEGDASVFVRLYSSSLFPLVVDIVVEPRRKSLTGWIHGVSIAFGKTSSLPVVTGYPLNGYVGQKVTEMATGQFKRYIPADNSPWSIAAWNSKAFEVWSNHCYCPANGGSGKAWTTSYTVNTFPLFEGDDLLHYESMSDEDIWNELLDRYRRLVNVR